MALMSVFSIASSASPHLRGGEIAQAAADLRERAGEAVAGTDNPASLARKVCYVHVCGLREQGPSFVFFEDVRPVPAAGIGFGDAFVASGEQETRTTRFYEKGCEVLDIPYIVHNNKGGLFAEDVAVAVLAGELALVAGEVFAQRLGDFTHARNEIAIPLAADSDPGDAVGKGALDGGVPAQRSDEHGLSDAPMPATAVTAMLVPVRSVKTRSRRAAMLFSRGMKC